MRSLKLLAAIGFVCLLAILAYRFVPEAWNNNGQSTGPVPQASPAAGAQLPLGAGEYQAQPEDNCWKIAELKAPPATPKKVTAFGELNALAIRQTSQLRGVPVEDCPITAGEVYKLPAIWGSSETVAQQPQQPQQPAAANNVGFDWKSVALIGIPIAFLVGVFCEWSKLRHHTFRFVLRNINPVNPSGKQTAQLEEFGEGE